MSFYRPFCMHLLGAKQKTQAVKASVAANHSRHRTRVAVGHVAARAISKGADPVTAAKVGDAAAKALKKVQLSIDAEKAAEEAREQEYARGVYKQILLFEERPRKAKERKNAAAEKVAFGRKLTEAAEKELKAAEEELAEINKTSSEKAEAGRICAEAAAYAAGAAVFAGALPTTVADAAEAASAIVKKFFKKKLMIYEPGRKAIDTHHPLLYSVRAAAEAAGAAVTQGADSATAEKAGEAALLAASKALDLIAADAEFKALAQGDDSETAEKAGFYALNQRLQSLDTAYESQAHNWLAYAAASAAGAVFTQLALKANRLGIYTTVFTQLGFHTTEPPVGPEKATEIAAKAGEAAADVWMQVNESIHGCLTKELDLWERVEADAAAAAAGAAVGAGDDPASAAKVGKVAANVAKKVVESGKCIAVANTAAAIAGQAVSKGVGPAFAAKIGYAAAEAADWALALGKSQAEGKAAAVAVGEAVAEQFQDSRENDISLREQGLWVDPERDLSYYHPENAAKASLLGAQAAKKAEESGKSLAEQEAAGEKVFEKVSDLYLEASERTEDLERLMSRFRDEVWQSRGVSEVSRGVQFENACLKMPTVFSDQHGNIVLNPLVITQLASPVLLDIDDIIESNWFNGELKKGNLLFEALSKQLRSDGDADEEKSNDESMSAGAVEERQKLRRVALSEAVRRVSRRCDDARTRAASELGAIFYLFPTQHVGSAAAEAMLCDFSKMSYEMSQDFDPLGATKCHRNKETAFFGARKAVHNRLIIGATLSNVPILSEYANDFRAQRYGPMAIVNSKSEYVAGTWPTNWFDDCLNYFVKSFRLFCRQVRIKFCGNVGKKKKKKKMSLGQINALVEGRKTEEQMYEERRKKEYQNERTKLLKSILFGIRPFAPKVFN